MKEEPNLSEKVEDREVKLEEVKENNREKSRIIGQFKDYIVVAKLSEVQISSVDNLDVVLERV